MIDSKKPFPTTRQGLEDAGYTYAGPGDCRSCSEPIIWFITPKKKRMPFEIAIAVEGSENILQPHFATCPQAQEWRKIRMGKKPGKGRRKI